MKNNILSSDKILDYIRSNPDISSTILAKYFGVTTVAIFYHIQALIQAGKIEAHGKSRATRYRIKESSLIPYSTVDISLNALNYIQETYEGTECIDIDTFFKDNLLILTPEGNWREGLDAFYEIVKKQNQSISPTANLFSQRLTSFLDFYFEQEQKRRKNGLFDGTESIRYTLQKYTEECFVNHVYFCEINKLGHWGKLRTGIELYHGKSLQDKNLLASSVNRVIDRIQKLFIKKSVDAMLITPPTLPRKVQFKDVFFDLFNRRSPVSLIENISIISAEKVKGRDFRPQKELRGKDRFINAQVSVSVNIPKYIGKLSHLVIIDDNFTTGATVNAIAGKLRAGGFQGDITVITVTGNFGYVPGVTDDEEI